MIFTKNAPGVDASMIPLFACSAIFTNGSFSGRTVSPYIVYGNVKPIKDSLAIHTSMTTAAEIWVMCDSKAFGVSCSILSRSLNKCALDTEHHRVKSRQAHRADFN